VVFPIINTLDFGIPKDEVGIWFGILVLTVVGIGLIAPPIGLGVLIVTSIARDVSIVQVYRRVLPFVAADFIRLAVLTAFPGVTLFVVAPSARAPQSEPRTHRQSRSRVIPP